MLFNKYKKYIDSKHTKIADGPKLLLHSLPSIPRHSFSVLTKCVSLEGFGTLALIFDHCL